MSMKKIERKKQILEFIEQYHAEHQWAPSIREITNGIGLKSMGQVHDLLLDMAKEKLIVYNGIRQIRVLKKPEEMVRPVKPAKSAIKKKRKKEERPKGSLLTRLL